ncbi:MAG: hypothetical protein GY953_54985, partial [bacterium]|nr:hypothetical protein [bacterium]
DELKDLPKRFRNGLPTQLPSIFYQRPWLGGRWGVHEAIDYMLTADFAILEHAATRPDRLLRKAYDLARASIELGKQGSPFAYIVPADQWDPYSAREMLRRLAAAGIRVHRAGAPFEVGDKTYAEGSFVLLAAQPFRPYLLDLMEPQTYPELRDGENGPTKRPYDVAGWTMRLSMGVDADRVDEEFTASLEKLDRIPDVEPTLNPRDSASYLRIADDLARGKKVRWGPGDRFELRRPRLALYEPYAANMDTGWTQWVLDTFQIPYTLAHNEDFRRGKLANYDAIILATQSPMSILHGHRAGVPSRKRTPELDAKSQQRPEYTGGIGIAGLEHLDQFVRQGGTLITFDNATELPIDYFPLPLRNTLRNQSGSGSKRYYCPGSLLHINVDTTHPLAQGMREESIAFSRGGKAFDITLLEDENKGDRLIRSVARYGEEDLLASGWLSGEDAVKGKHILLEAGHGKGKVILFGFRPQFRGQTFGTFKFLLNAVYLASAKPIQP